jgi:hypothetical protein
LSLEAACLLCGERDVEVLREHKAASVPATVLETHHLGGRANDPDLVVVLCLNCHRRMSTRLPTHGVELTSVDDRSWPAPLRR